MKIYLLDCNPVIVKAWHEWFDEFHDPNIEIVHDDFESFMSKHPEIEAVVSPANSYGFMMGGYDLAITDYFGADLMRDVQQKILDEWYGEQPVGTSITVPISARNCILIHTPTMRMPECIVDHRIIYQCMRSTLIEAYRNGVSSIVIPAFGGLTGNIEAKVVAQMMAVAYKQIKQRPSELTWGYGYHIGKLLNANQ